MADVTGGICPVKGQASRARNLRSVGELLSPAAAAAAAAAAAPYNHYGQQHDERASGPRYRRRSVKTGRGRTTSMRRPTTNGLRLATGSGRAIRQTSCKRFCDDASHPAVHCPADDSCPSRERGTELHILWSELSGRKLSPTLTTAHCSCPDNAIGLYSPV